MYDLYLNDRIYKVLLLFLVGKFIILEGNKTLYNLLYGY